MNRRIGLAVIIIGIAHTLLGLIRFNQEFLAMLSEGLLGVGGGDTRGWAFWFTFAGVLMILLGLSFRSIEAAGGTISKPIGWIMLVSSAIGAAIYPVSGFWLVLVVSLFILFNRSAHSIIS